MLSSNTVFVVGNGWTCLQDCPTPNTCQPVSFSGGESCVPLSEDLRAALNNLQSSTTPETPDASPLQGRTVPIQPLLATAPPVSESSSSSASGAEAPPPEPEPTSGRTEAPRPGPADTPAGEKTGASSNTPLTNGEGAFSWPDLSSVDWRICLVALAALFVARKIYQRMTTKPREAVLIAAATEAQKTPQAPVVVNVNITMTPGSGPVPTVKV